MEHSVLDKYFGNVALSMLSLYKITMDGIHWGVIFDPVMKHCPAWVSALLLVYTSLMTLGVTNVVASIFVTFALKHGEEDRKIVNQNKARLFFEDADGDG